MSKQITRFQLIEQKMTNFKAFIEAALGKVEGSERVRALYARISSGSVNQFVDAVRCYVMKYRSNIEAFIDSGLIQNGLAREAIPAEDYEKLRRYLLMFCDLCE